MGESLGHLPLHEQRHSGKGVRTDFYLFSLNTPCPLICQTGALVLHHQLVAHRRLPELSGGDDSGAKRLRGHIALQPAGGRDQAHDRGAKGRKYLQKHLTLTSSLPLFFCQVW